MRKRIVIGIGALVVGGGIVVVVLRPWESQVEYHKREYFAARNGRFLDHVRETWNRVVGQSTDYRERAARMESHETALIKLGYLEERTFAVSNRPAAGIAVEIGNFHPGIAKGRLWNVFHTSTNELAVVGVREDMPKWEELIRKADVP